jgi:hypothetical protein
MYKRTFSISSWDYVLVRTVISHKSSERRQGRTGTRQDWRDCSWKPHVCHITGTRRKTGKETKTNKTYMLGVYPNNNQHTNTLDALQVCRSGLGCQSPQWIRPICKVYIHTIRLCLHAIPSQLQRLSAHRDQKDCRDCSAEPRVCARRRRTSLILP